MISFLAKYFIWLSVGQSHMRIYYKEIGSLLLNIYKPFKGIKL